MFSALGAPRKVVDTIFESSNHWEQLYDMQFPEFFNMVEEFQWNDISLLGKSRVGSENWLPNQSSHKDVAVANTFRALTYSPIVITRNCNHRVEHFENRIEA